MRSRWWWLPIPLMVMVLCVVVWVKLATPDPVRLVWCTETAVATVTRVIDGDTLVADVSIGWGIVLPQRHLRIINIDAPELRGTERYKGEAARDFAIDEVAQADGVIELVRHGEDSFRRDLVEVRYLRDGVRANLGEVLVESGHAEVWTPKR